MELSCPFLILELIGTLFAGAGGFSLKFSIGFGFSYAAVAGDALEGVHFGNGFQLHKGFDGLGDGLGANFCRSDGDGEMQEEDELSTDLRAGGQTSQGFRNGEAQELFVELGEFASEDYGLRWGEDAGDIGEGFQNAVGGLVKNVSNGTAGKALKLAAALAGF